MNAINPRRLPPVQSLDIAMRALYDIARFCCSGARIGMAGPDVATHAEFMARRATSCVEALEMEAGILNSETKRIETMNADIIAMQSIAAELQMRGMSDLSSKVSTLAETLDRSLTLVRDYAISECIGVCAQAANSFGVDSEHAKLCTTKMHALLEDPQA